MRIARGDLESKYRRVELLFQALEDYFKLRGLPDAFTTTRKNTHNPNTQWQKWRSYKGHCYARNFSSVTLHYTYEPLAKRLVLSGLGALLGPAGRP